MSDQYNLQRFLDAQARIFEEARTELREGEKRGHWMWFIFPQIEGLGHSSIAAKFAISSLDEAKAYLDHPVLGARLRECTHLIILIKGCSIEKILGHTDALKFRSSLTLFAHATSDNQLFKDALQKYFGGQFDPLTLARL
jgi:uncharacterized protein (DUF1810 family)